MGDLDLYSVAYLIFRLAPFILVASFLVPSLLFMDMKGVVYLAGLLIACGLTTMCEGMIPKPEVPVPPKLKCSIISAGESGLYSEIPISMTVYSYTFWFLFMFILNVNPGHMADAIQQNMMVIVVFTLIIFTEGLWLVNNQCVSNWLFLLAACVVGCGVGAIWGSIIVAAKSPGLQYVSNDNQTCSLNKKTFKCKKTG